MRKINMKTLHNKSLILALTLNVLMGTSLQANFDLEEINMENYRRHYNALPSADESNLKLKNSTQFKPFLKDAEEVVTRYGFESHVGFRLLHKHFSAEDNQIIAEEYKVVEGIPSLVTWAQTFEEAQAQSALPASWVFKNGQEKPLMFEASTDEAVQVGAQMLQREPEFMEEMSKLLYTSGLNDLLAVSLLKRGSLVGSDDQMYVERTSMDGYKSILQLGYEKDQPENIIRTSWSFKGPRQQGCITISACQPTPQGGHVTVYTHIKI